METNFKSPAIWVLAVSLTVSIGVLVVFFVETGISDDTLFFLLAVLRYSSFLLCVSSIYLTVTGLRNNITSPKVLPVLGIVVCFCLVLFSLGIIFIDAFILTITGGKE